MVNNRHIEISKAKLKIGNIQYSYNHFSNSILKMRYYSKTNKLFIYVKQDNKRELNKIERKIKQKAKKNKIKQPKIMFIID